ncbi:hypothetical protein R1flu_013348 [Riccia fluitans]|uniref:Uncharacterized protein n=1 Tax=Riccia fluitans TaxID=41844 RepID=A0ABD1YG63_9MARC
MDLCGSLEGGYNLPKASPGGYVMKGKIQFIELQLLKVVKGEPITNQDEPTPNWGEAIQKTVARQIKRLGVCNEATCLGPYLAHLYTHFHEMETVEKEASKKRKASIKTVSDSDTKTEPEEEREPLKEVPRVFFEGEASGSKPLNLKLDFAEWKNRVESFSREKRRLLRSARPQFRPFSTLIPKLSRKRKGNH